MIDKITSPITVAAQPTGTGTGKGTGNEFNAALKAAEQAEARRKDHEEEMKSIREKGFTNWVRDMKIDKLKEELRKKVMARMGIDDEKLADLMPSVRAILERQIEAEVQRQLAEAEEQAKPNKDAKDTPKVAAASEAEPTVSRQNLPGKNDRNGKTCPVIPALVWPGGVINI